MQAIVIFRIQISFPLLRVGGSMLNSDDKLISGWLNKITAEVLETLIEGRNTFLFIVLLTLDDPLSDSACNLLY